MVDTARKQPLLTKEQEDDLFMLVVEDDTEEAPWMAVGDAQFWSASSLAHSLRIYAHEQGLPWYVASMLPLTYTWPGMSRKKTVAPDVLVSFVPERVRGSYDVAAEGVFPAFVLEVVSPSSVVRDTVEKYRIYNALGAQEYVLFTPEGSEAPLQGYRRGASGELEPCPLDAKGRLHSAVLDLDLTVDGLTLQAMTRDGRLLLTPEQTEEARRAGTLQDGRLTRVCTIAFLGSPASSRPRLGRAGWKPAVPGGAAGCQRSESRRSQGDGWRR